MGGGWPSLDHTQKRKCCPVRCREERGPQEHPVLEMTFTSHLPLTLELWEGALVVGKAQVTGGLAPHAPLPSGAPPWPQGQVRLPAVAGHLRGQLAAVWALLGLLGAVSRPRVPGGHCECNPGAQGSGQGTQGQGEDLGGGEDPGLGTKDLGSGAEAGGARACSVRTAGADCTHAMRGGHSYGCPRALLGLKSPSR